MGTMETLQPTLGGNAVRLELPESFAARTDVIAAFPKHYRRASWAALALCLTARDAKKLGVKYEQFDCDVLRFGGAVFDELRRREIEELEIWNTSQLAVKLIVEWFRGKPVDVKPDNGRFGELVEAEQGGGLESDIEDLADFTEAVGDGPTA